MKYYAKKWHILGQFLSIWGVVRFRFRTFLYSSKYCKKYNSPKKQSSQLAGEPLEPLGYFCMRLMKAACPPRRIDMPGCAAAL